jgi:hypothetical protein
MKRNFSIHPGEYLTGSYIQKRFRHVNIWVPAKDTGIDLLVTDRTNRQTVSLQVKYSKDYLAADMQKRPPELKRTLRACGWWTFDSGKMSNSSADYWVLVLEGFYNATVDYVVIPPKELEQRLCDIHVGISKPKKWQVYVWVTKTGPCWETRGLNQEDERQIGLDKYSDPNRDFKKYLDAWGQVERLNQD